MNFEVVIIGSDANAYYMARCAHEAYGKKVKLISVKPMSFVVHSSIMTQSMMKDFICITKGSSNGILLFL